MIIDIFEDFYWIYKIQVVRIVVLVLSNTHAMNPSLMLFSCVQMYASDWSHILHISGRKKVLALDLHSIMLLLVRLTSLLSNTDFEKFTNFRK